MSGDDARELREWLVEQDRAEIAELREWLVEQDRLHAELVAGIAGE